MKFYIGVSKFQYKVSFLNFEREVSDLSFEVVGGGGGGGVHA